MKSANHVSSISTTVTQAAPTTLHTTPINDMSSEHAAELCSNWWPEPRLALSEAIPGMPHPLCRMCANWLPDIEDIGRQHTKKACCGNDWPKERNLRSSVLPTAFSPVQKEAPRPVLSLNSLAPRTDQKFQ